MDDKHTLTRHRDIQKWVTGHNGTPAITKIRDRTGAQRARLAIKFAQIDPRTSLSVDDGLSPVAWSAWLAELDRQGLALQVGDQKAFELVARGDRGLH